MSDDDAWAALVPELTVRELDVSLAFYEAIGFRVRWRRDDPPFAYLVRGPAQVMLEQQHASSWVVGSLAVPFGRGVNFQLEVADVAAVAAAVQAHGAPIFRPVCDTWYAVSATVEEGQRELLVQDPDGYLWRFAEVLGPRSRSSAVAE